MIDQTLTHELEEALNCQIRERILVIDDEKRICDSLSVLLTDSGFEVAVFENSDDAAQEIKTGNFDIIISDIKMPGLSGLDLLKLARKVDPQAMVILMTGFASLESAIEAINQGVYDYLLKPVEFPQLEMVIKRGLEKRRLGRAKSFLLTQLQAKNTELEDRLFEINALYEAGKSISSTLKLNELLHRIVDLAADVLRARQGSIMLLDNDRRYLSIAAARGLDEEIIRETWLPIGNSIAGYVADKGEPLFITNVESDPRFSRENKEERYGNASLLSVPLIYNDEVIGVINIANKRSKSEFNEYDLKLLTTFASQAATAINNASIVHQLRRRVAELSALQDIGDAMSRAGSVENLQEIIFCGIRNLMPVEMALWFRWDERVRKLIFTGGAGNQRLDLRLEIKAGVEEFTTPGKAEELIREHLDNMEGNTIPTAGLMAFPITGITGVDYLFCLAFREKDIYSAEDRQIAGLIARQAASMYEREKSILNATRLLTMGNMISEISHDMRKPLTSIKGALQIMRDRWPELAESSDLFKTAESEVQRLNELVRELVDFSNPNKYQTERTNLSDLMQKAVHLVKPDLEKNNIKCDYDFDPDLGDVFINRNQIMEMLINLIMNAVDAIGSEGGKITLKTSMEQVKKRMMVRMEVFDTGCGIDDKDKSAIFDRYFTTKETGTGLGLAVVERIVSAHNGKLEVKSQKGKGTNFVIHLPV